MGCCEGAARKVSCVITGLSILGWIVFIVGFGLRIERYDKNNMDSAEHTDLHVISPLHEDAFPYWCFAVVAPLLYISYFFHLCFNVRFTHYLSILFAGLFLVSGGGVLYLDGLTISVIHFGGEVEFKNASYYDKSDEAWVMVEFIGALFSIFVHWFSMMMWPCFKKNKTKGYYDY